MINIGVRIQLTGPWHGMSPEDRMHLMRPALKSVLALNLEAVEYLGDWIQFGGLVFGSPEDIRRYLDARLCCGHKHHHRCNHD